MIITSFIFLFNFSKGQTMEYFINIDGGMYALRGNGTTSLTWLIPSNPLGQSWFVENPYGSIPALSYGISGQVQRVTNKKIIFGADLGFEILRSRENLENLANEITGSTVLTNHFFNITPFLGYRIISGNDLKIDCTVGIDMGYYLYGETTGQEIEPNGSTIKTNTSTSNGDLIVINASLPIDLRPGSQLRFYYKHYGIYIGYSYGITNYLGSSLENAYSRFVRFGLNYKIK